MKIPAGTFEDEIFAQVQKQYPEAKNSVYALTHPAYSRAEKQGWSAERTLDALTELLDAKQGTLVKNWKQPAKERHQALYGTLVPYDVDPIFSPFFLDKHHNIILKTVFNPSNERMKKLGYGVEGGKPFISRNLQGTKSMPGIQPLPISVVAPQPSVEMTLGVLLQGVKRNRRSVVGLGGGAMAFSPGAAQGREPSSSFADDRSWAVDENGEPIPDISGGVALAGEAGRGLGLGVRNVLEGFGSLTDTLLNRPVDVFGNMPGRDVGLTNPGKARADVMGLPEAETDMERNIASVPQGAVADIPLMLTGAGMAKMALTPVMRGVGRALVASPVADTVLEGYWAFLTEARLECAGRGEREGTGGRGGRGSFKAATVKKMEKRAFMPVVP